MRRRAATKDYGKRQYFLRYIKETLVRPSRTYYKAHSAQTLWALGIILSAFFVDIGPTVIAATAKGDPYPFPYAFSLVHLK